MIYLGIAAYIAVAVYILWILTLVEQPVNFKDGLNITFNSIIWPVLLIIGIFLILKDRLFNVR